MKSFASLRLRVNQQQARVVSREAPKYAKGSDMRQIGQLGVGAVARYADFVSF